MGLELVELVMECEEVFGVSIPDEEASRCATAGDLLNLLTKLQERRRGPEPLHAGTVFFRLRQGLIDCGAAGAHRILPTDRLDDLLPWQQRPLLWRQLGSATGFTLPLLVPSRGRRTVVLLASLALALASGFVVGRWYGVVLAVGLGAALIVASRKWILPAWSSRFPKAMQTLGDLAERVAVQNQSLNEQEAWRILRGIIAQVLAVRPEEISPTTRFHEDLNVG